MSSFHGRPLRLQRKLQRVQQKLKFPRPAHSDVVQPRNQQGGSDRHQLPVGNREWMRNRAAREPIQRNAGVQEEREDRKCFQDPHQPGSDGRNRSRFSDQKPGPGIKKSRQRPVGVANVHILTAGLRLHGAQFGICKRAEKREQPPNHPGEIDKSSRPHRLHHLGWNQKNPAPDDRPNHHRPGMRQPKVACQFWTGMILCSSVHLSVDRFEERF